MGGRWELDTSRINNGWECLRGETEQDYFDELRLFLHEESKSQTIFPDSSHVFTALETTALESVKVLLLGQDPYHGVGQAHGLCFSVLPGTPIPPSLKNIYRELSADVAVEPVEHGFLLPWAAQGVLMLNTVLTVRAHEANSHRRRGWEQFTDAIIRQVAAKSKRVVFLLWGNPAQKKRQLIHGQHHVIIESAHPSPLSARRGFFGSRPFSRVNHALREANLTEINWQLPPTAVQPATACGGL